ncbi:MAG: transporter substrate-binding domain-containing protein, partial [Pseudomonadota bacterium]
SETVRTRRRLRFTIPYMRMAGRFVSRTNSVGGPAARPSTGIRISVVSESAHEAFLTRFVPEAIIVPFDDATGARNALSDGSVALHFGDAVSLSFWLQSEGAEGCCVFSGGPFFDETYFGRGLSVAVPEEATSLKATLDYGLQRLVANGKFREIFIRSFPVSPF